MINIVWPYLLWIMVGSGYPATGTNLHPAVQNACILLERSNAYTILPDTLGGNKMHGFAVLQARYSSKLQLNDVNLMKLEVPAANISYFYPNKLTKGAGRFLPFFKGYAALQRVKKSDKNCTDHTVAYIIRF